MKHKDLLAQEFDIYKSILYTCLAITGGSFHYINEFNFKPDIIVLILSILFVIGFIGTIYTLNNIKRLHKKLKNNFE